MENVNDLVAIGKQYFDNKEYIKAEQYLRKVLQMNTNYADVLNMLGVIHHIEGKFTSAIEFFQKALKINPHYTEALLNLAVLYNDLGKYKDAKKLYTQLHTAQKAKHRQIEPVLKGKLSNLHANIGDVYRSLGLYQHAIEEYKKALALNPTYADIRMKLGISFRENGQTRESLSELKHVVKTDPKYIQARVQLGVTLFSSGQEPSAKKEWKKAIEKDPSNEHAKMYLRLSENKDHHKK